MEPIRVAVAGAAGKMGLEVLRAIAQEPDMQLVGAADPRLVGVDAGEAAGLGEIGVAGVAAVQDLAAFTPHVIVDFTAPAKVKANVLAGLALGAHVVVGTTGMTTNDLQELDDAARKVGKGVLVAPNFAIGAILLMRFAQEAARYLPHAEIVELHHNQKADAPSGTALKTAELMLNERDAFGVDNAPEVEKIPGVRGGEVGGIRIHSVRLPGLVAHQEVMFGGLGQVLTIRHDSLSRESFMPGVMLGIRKVRELEGLVYGLEHVM